MQATKSKPRCASDCKDHLFQLKNNNGNNKHNATITFCPKFRRDPHPPQKTIPEYNLDNKYYTNAFILGTQKKVIIQNCQQQYMSFQTQIKDACQKNNQLFFPRPNQNNSYCSVCKAHYQNYLQHIRAEDHKINIDAALYNNQIKRLCDCYKHLWNGAHQKADQIVNQIFLQQKLLQKNNDEGNDDSNDDDIQSQQLNDSQDDLDQQQPSQMQNEDQKDTPQYSQLRKDSNKKSLLQQQSRPNQKKKKSSQTHTDHQKYPSQLHDSQNPSKSKFHNQFIQKGSDLILYLKKNNNNKYQIIKNVQQTFLQLQKQQKSSKQQIYKQQHKPIKKSIQKPSKQHRQIYKIKQPYHQKQQSSQYHANLSSQQYNQNNNLCQTLKDQFISNRIRTRKQCQQIYQKQDLNHNYQAYKKKYDPNHKQKQKYQSSHQDKYSKSHKYQLQPPRQQHLYNHRGNPSIIQGYNNNSNNQINYNRNQPIQHMQQNGYQINHPSQHIMPKQGNRMGGQQPYMPHPSMIMNAPYFNQNMMGYGMPIQNDQILKNDDKSKRTQHYPPIYYSASWGPPHYMIQPQPGAMIHPNSTNERLRQQIPHNIPPNIPYQMMQNSNNVQPNSQMMGHKMNMCLPYEMDPQYYMGYPPPYMPKKGEDPRHPQ